MWDYTDKVKDHFLHPRNARVIEDANAVGDVGSIICGDALRLMLKIDPVTEVIEDASFQTYGCGSAIASSSALTEMLKGKTLKEAEKITNQEIVDYLGGLPPEKMHCSVMGREALDAAIANYHGQSYENSHDDGELVCHCFGVGINKIKKAVWENHLTTVEEVTNYTKAGGGCGSCKMRIEEIIDEVWVDLEKCGVPRPGHAPTPIPSITVSTSTTSSPAFSSIGTVASAKSATAAVNAQIDEKTKSSPIYEDVVKILKEVSDGLTDGSKVELDAISGADVIVKLEGPAASGMMKDMTLGYLKQKLTDGTGRQINVTTR
ncbi:MAG: Fe-S cluster assembly protein NifU [Succinivibrio dextrinosolvens]|uniref:Fe-S cluster assembly protein NifU n=1 Tax=Succinivibrio sp. TaxID=2053619 RepID=UPI0025D5C390|nr:Fe-S cluster assembly protein NifU [Succinivibrio sp.]MBQ9221577.1 Fe-S cluster assembly protein NifU [Succinivibrio sp.]MDY6419809.1 Fe-S cluster assembly protein NifU [Succinivibrio dextrinosolvens]